MHKSIGQAYSQLCKYSDSLHRSGLELCALLSGSRYREVQQQYSEISQRNVLQTSDELFITASRVLCLTETRTKVTAAFPFAVELCPRRLQQNKYPFSKMDIGLSFHGICLVLYLQVQFWTLAFNFWFTDEY